MQHEDLLVPRMELSRVKASMTLRGLRFPSLEYGRGVLRASATDVHGLPRPLAAKAPSVELDTAAHNSRQCKAPIVTLLLLLTLPVKQLLDSMGEHRGGCARKHTTWLRSENQ